MAAEAVQVPAEDGVLGLGGAGTEAADLPRFQRRVPKIEIGDISNKGLRKIPSERVLVLTQDEYPISVDILGGVCVRARVLPVPVHVDGPAAVAAVPRDADVVPRSVVGKRRLIGQMLPVDDERQQDPPLHVHLSPQLELIGEDRRGVGEDGGHLVPPGVPLDSNTNTDGRQVREGHVDPSKALWGILREVQRWKRNV